MSVDGTPVFYDKTGKRWTHVRVTVAVIGVLIVAMGAWLVPKTIAPVQGGTAVQANIGLQQSTLKNIPVVGKEGSASLARVDRVKRRGGDVYLVDPVNGRTFHKATPSEKEAIGQSDYALEWFGQPPKRQLVLTFDDGPDLRNTPKILDILSREHVPATFFVVGQNVLKHPELTQRIIREGHMLGNHTLTHQGVDKSALQNRQELVATDRLLRASQDYGTSLFRIPKGDPDHSPSTILEVQRLGYIDVDMDMDPVDWKYRPGQTIPLPRLDGRGHVVLLHDGGNDRAATVDFLKRFIPAAKAKGYSFQTAATVVPPEYIPGPAAPTMADRATWWGMWSIWVLPGKLLGGLFWFGAVSLCAMSALYIAMSVAYHYRHRQVVKAHSGAAPPVSIVVPMYNEFKVAARTLKALATSDHPDFEIIAVDDGSTDGTWRVLQECTHYWPQLRVYRFEENQGKAAALNFGISRARYEVIVTLDGDTIFERETVRKLARHFEDPRVGVVAGNIKVGNPWSSPLTLWQSLEYVTGIHSIRMAEALVGAVMIAPGACAAWRKSALLAVGGYPSDTQAEDCAVTIAIQKLRRYKVIQESEAIAWTEAPITLKSLARQRVRWTFGTLQALYKFRGMMLRPRYGVLGTVVLPYAVLSVAVPLIFLPLTYIAAAMNLAAGNWEGIALFSAFVAGVHLLISTVALAISRERPWHLLVVPFYRIVYEPLRAYLLYTSLLRAVRGRLEGWYRPERTNTVHVGA